MKKYLLLLFFILSMDNENPLFGQKNVPDSTVVHKSFRIASKPANQYEGTYKSGKPHNGYFLGGDREFKWVDYYENGIIMFQYSNDYLKNLEKYQYPMYDLKSTYKDGKIIDGQAYKIIEKGFVTKNIEKGKLKSVFLDLFAMHYFNRITLEKQNDIIKISNTQEPDAETRFYLKDKLLTIEISAKNKTAFYSEYIILDLQNLPKNRTVYRIKNGKIISCSANKQIELSDEDYKEMGDLKINLKVAEGLIIQPTNDLDNVFQQIADFLSQEESVSLMYMNEAKEPLFMTYLTTDDKGKIINGIHFTEEKTPFYEIYKEGKSIKKEQKTLEEFQKIGMKYLENRF